MILGDVEETITTVEVDDETYEEIIKVSSHPWLPQLQLCVRQWCVLCRLVAKTATAQAWQPLNCASTLG
jgi:hypothetical protein